MSPEIDGFTRGPGDERGVSIYDRALPGVPSHGAETFF